MLNTTINGYTIKTLLGKGGMAEVYYAENQLSRPAAIKVLRPEFQANEDIRKRFVREAQTIAFLKHPNIRQVYDMGETAGKSFILMEYLEGMDLKHYIETHGPIAEERAVKWVAEALSGLGYAHGQGVVHRDIKPSNIFLKEDGQIKLLDFGIAKVKHDGLELTGTNTQMGTTAYMSPEQIRTPKQIDHRSDIYSMGVTLWTLINGSPPYNTKVDSEYAVLEKIVREPLPPLAKCSMGILNVIAAATSKQEAGRFADCTSMTAALTGEWSDLTQTDSTIVDNNIRTDNMDSREVPSLPKNLVGKRIAAFSIDFFLFGILPSFTILPYFLLSAMFEGSLLQSTPGKHLFGLKVGKMPNGDRLRFWPILKRQFFKFITLLNVPEWFLITDPEWKPVHDRWTDSYVFRRKN